MHRIRFYVGSGAVVVDTLGREDASDHSAVLTSNESQRSIIASMPFNCARLRE